MPFVSIIVPVHNGAELLAPCLESIGAQTFGDYELIVVDDASTDATPEVLAAYAASDARVRVVTRAVNGYAGTARNDGMHIAQGDYLFFLDADDLFEPTLLECVASRAAATHPDVVLFGADVFEGVDLATAHRDPFLLDEALVPARRPFNRDDVADCLFQLCTPEPWTKLFSRSFVEREGLVFQDLHNANDLLFTLSAIALARCIDVVPNVLVHHRTGQAGSVQGRKAAEPLAFLDALRALRAVLADRGLLAQLETSFANLVLFHCIYNSQAPANWPRVFVELGVSGHPKCDFFIPGDFERYVDMLLDAGFAGIAQSDYCPDVWYAAALRSAERVHDVNERMQSAVGETRAAYDELARVKSSASLAIGQAMTWLPRTLRAALKGGR